jgi:hypothetical protein
MGYLMNDAGDLLPWSKYNRISEGTQREDKALNGKPET